MTSTKSLEITVKPSGKTGFTLIELLVVIAIIAKPKQERHCDVVEATESGDQADLERLEGAAPQ